MEGELGFCFLFQFILSLFIENVATATGELEECISISRTVYILVLSVGEITH